MASIKASPLTVDQARQFVSKYEELQRWAPETTANDSLYYADLQRNDPDAYKALQVYPYLSQIKERYPDLASWVEGKVADYNMQQHGFRMPTMSAEKYEENKANIKGIKAALKAVQNAQYAYDNAGAPEAEDVVSDKDHAAAALAEAKAALKNKYGMSVQDAEKFVEAFERERDVRSEYNYYRPGMVAQIEHSGEKPTKPVNQREADGVYRLVNGLVTNPNTHSFGGIDVSAHEYISKDQRDAYNAIYERNGIEAANEFYKSIIPYLNIQRAAADEAYYKKFADEHPFWADLRSIGANLVWNVPASVENISKGIQGRFTEERPYYDVNSSASFRSGRADIIRSERSQNILTNMDRPDWAKKALNFAYNTGMSIGDSAAVMALAYLGAPPAVTSVVFGSSAGNQAYKDAMERGATQDQALSYAIVNGVAEALFEEVSLEKVMTMDFTGRGALIKNLLSQSFVEGSEELATGVADLLGDLWIMQDKSQYNLAKKQYIAQGMTEYQAERQAFLDQVKDVGMDALGGFISGAAFAGGGAVLSSAQHKVAGKKLREGNSATMDRYTRAAQILGGKSMDALQQYQAEQTDTNAGKLKAAVDDTFRDLFGNGEMDIPDVSNASSIANAKQNPLRADAALDVDAAKNERVIDRATAGAAMLSGDKMNTTLAKTIMDVLGDGYLRGQGYDVSSPQAFSNDYNARLDKYGIKPYAEVQTAATPKLSPQTGTLADARLRKADQAFRAESPSSEGGILAGKALQQRQQNRQQVDLKAKENAAANRVWKNPNQGYTTTADGKQVMSLPGNMTAVARAEYERKNFKAHTTAKMDGVTMELSGMEARKGLTDAQVFAEAKKAMTKDAAQKLDVYMKLSKALSLPMVIRDVVAGTSGYVHDGKLYVTLSGQQSIPRVVAHELTHFMQQHASEKYDALRTHLVADVGGKAEFEKLMREKAGRYGLDLSNEAERMEADDEVCAELCERMLSDTEALERFAEKNVGAATTLRDRLLKILNAVKAALKDVKNRDFGNSKSDLITQEETIEAWYDGISEAIKNANEQKAAEAKKETATEAEAKEETTTNTSASYSLDIDSEGRVLSSQQQEYFKDSSIRDDNGKLLALYHGTTYFGEITQFRKGKSGWLGPGIYLTSRKADAQRYANAIGEGNGTVYELYANAKNPLVVSSADPAQDILRAIYGTDTVFQRRSANQGNATSILTAADIKKLQSKGYDGIRWNYANSTEVSVFSPEQVKRTDNTSPTSSRDIRYSIDTEYMDLAEKYKSGTATKSEAEQLQKAVDQAARKAGYTTKAYHGTTSDFTKFDKSKIGSATDEGVYGRGFYFSPSRQQSEHYSKGKAPMEVFLNTGNQLLLNDHSSVEELADLLNMSESNFTQDRSTGVVRPLYSQVNQFAAHVQEAGYDSVRADYGASDEIVMFDSDRIKSASPVTYDDKGNIIPLSERFNAQSDDIRNSIDEDFLSDGAIEDQLSNVDVLPGTRFALDTDGVARKPGYKPKGKAPRARDIDVPEVAKNGKRVSDFTRSFLESNKVTNEIADELIDKVESGEWGGYTRLTNEEAMNRAKDYIAKHQVVKAQQDFHDMVMSGQYNVNTRALGLQLLTEAAQRGDKAALLDIASDLRVLATDAGQSVQIFSVLKDLGGVGSSWYLQKVVERMNNKYADQIASGKMNEITVPQELYDQLEQAKTTPEVTAAEAVIAKNIADQLPLTWTDRLSNWRYMAMLANPTTHVRNLFGNLLMGAMNTTKDVVAAGIERIGIRDQSKRTHAVLTVADRQAMNGFADQAYADNEGLLRQNGKFSFENEIRQNMRSFDTKALNAVAQTNFNLLEKEDMWFIKPAFKSAFMQYLKAQGYTMQGGVAGKTLNGEFKAMTNAQQAQAVEYAAEQAWKATFHDASALATMLNKISGMNKVSRLIVEGVMPFKKTPINIAKRGIEYSLAGIVKGLVQLGRDVRNGKATTSQAIDNLASGITGTALMAVGLFLSKAGLIRVGDDDDKKLSTYLSDTGDQTYSLKLGKYSFALSALAPATIPLFMGAALNEMVNKSGGELDLSTVTNTISGTLNPFMEMSFMSSLNSALKNYGSEGIGGALGNSILTSAENYFSQYLPTVVGKVGQFADPTVRTTKSSATSPIGSGMDYYVRSLAKKIPGVEATLQPDVNVWGRTTKKDTFQEWALDFANKFILPANVKISNRDAVDDELIRVVETTGETSFLPSDGAKKFKYMGEDYKMTAEQYTEFSKDRGIASYAALKEVIASDAYQSAPDNERATMLENALKAAQKQVNTIWKEKLGAYDPNPAPVQQTEVKATEGDYTDPALYKVAASYPTAYDKAAKAKAKGISPDTFLSIYEARDQYNGENQSRFTREQIMASNLTVKQKEFMDDLLVSDKGRNPDYSSPAWFEISMLGKSQYEEAKLGEKVGLKPETYLTVYKQWKSIDAKDKNGKTVYGLKKKRAKEYIDSLPISAPVYDYIWTAVFGY